MRTAEVRLALRGGTVTALTYVAGMAVGVAAGNVVESTLAGDMSVPLRVTLFLFPPIGGLLLGSGLWGVWMGRLADTRDTRRMAATGILGLVPVTLALGVGLVLLESAALSDIGAGLSVHRIFTLLFVPTAFIIAAVGSLALGVGLRSRVLARSWWWRVGLVAAAAFLVVDLAMEALGWRVGGPGAAERFTMVTVTFVGALGAALAGGAVIGFAVARHGPTSSGGLSSVGGPS